MYNSISMARITEELIRKCAEHNECEIFSLEELSLHQRNIIKIEHIDRWCRDLKILLLHNNLISKIEHLSRLKKLEYINFTLNNITKIENLDGCESLKKLDFTVNFIGELTSIESLKNNFNLEELYLTGNPCADFEGYREYVIFSLPQLIRLDGEHIKKSERILAMQKYPQIHGGILEQQRNYMKKVGQNGTENNFSPEDELEKDNSVEEKNFWKTKSSFTPQSRIEMYKEIEKSRKKKSTETKKKSKLPRKLITDDGRILNVNEPKLDFEFIDDEESNSFRLDLAVYRYIDTSLLESDVEPTYVRVKVKNKYFQLVLPAEVSPGLSTSQRSQTTGHLLITMPKVKPFISKARKTKFEADSNIKTTTKTNNKLEKLEVTPGIINLIDKIVSSQEPTMECSVKPSIEIKNGEKINSEFVDNPEVPPLI